MQPARSVVGFQQSWLKLFKSKYSVPGRGLKIRPRPDLASNTSPTRLPS